MNAFHIVNLTLIVALPVFLYFHVCSRLFFHPVMVSMALGIFPFLVGAEIMASEVGLSEKFFYFLVAAVAGCLSGRGFRKIAPNYEIGASGGNTDAHRIPYCAAVAVGTFIVVLFFLRRGVPLFSEEPNLAKIEIARDGGFVFTRFIRYYIPMLFYAALAYGFYAVRNKLGGGKVWVVVGSVLLVFFAFLGYKANVFAFFFWSVCFVGLFVRLRLKAAIPFLIAGVAVSFRVAMALQHMTFDETSAFVFDRATRGGAAGFVYILGHYGADEPFLMGEGFWYDLSNILLRLGLGPLLPFNLHELNFDARIAEKLIGHNEYKMQAGTLLGGQLYANFGLFSALLGTFAFFHLYVKFGNFLITHRKSLIWTPVCFFLFQQFQAFMAGGPVVLTAFDTALSLAMFFSFYGAVYLFMHLPYGRLSFRVP